MLLNRATRFRSLSQAPPARWGFFLVRPLVYLRHQHFWPARPFCHLPQQLARQSYNYDQTSPFQVLGTGELSESQTEALIREKGRLVPQ